MTKSAPRTGERALAIPRVGQRRAGRRDGSNSAARAIKPDGD